MLKKAQKDLCLEIFKSFTNEDKFPGWGNIAEKLINTGKCIVAGDECIWKIGVGNFIKTSHAKGTVGCLLYKFDADDFIKSELYKEIRNNKIIELKKEINEQKVKLEELELHLLDV